MPILPAPGYPCFSENPKIILVVEWGEYYPEKYRPNESLDIFFKIENDSRCFNIC